MNSLVRKLAIFIGFSLLALFLIGLSGAVWGGLLYLNFWKTPSFPWALLALFAYLWFYWRYLAGWGWPSRTSAKRQALLRANTVSPAAYKWSALAGLLAVVALAGLWITLFRIFPIKPNPLIPTNFTSSPLLIAAITVGASLLAPITEESAVRGYLQSALERNFTPAIAITLSSLVFALAHATQGLVWPKLLFYFLVGMAFGTLAYVNQSILPVIPVHIAGDLIFLTLVWPNDKSRVPVWQTGADVWFWVHFTQTITFAALSIVALSRIPLRVADYSEIRSDRK
jgi:membrane protease YdiL (CAAX protease family)